LPNILTVFFLDVLQLKQPVNSSSCDLATKAVITPYPAFSNLEEACQNPLAVITNCQLSGDVHTPTSHSGP